MDAKLPWHRRLAVKIHLLYCVWCRRYAEQMKLLRKATGALQPEDLSADEKLSSEQKQQMRARLEQNLKNPPSSPQ